MAHLVRINGVKEARAHPHRNENLQVLRSGSWMLELELELALGLKHEMRHRRQIKTFSELSHLSSQGNNDF